MGEIRPPLTKMVLNNFVVQKRPVVRQAKIHIINGLVHSTRRLRKKMEKDEGQCNKLEAKADRLVKEVLFIKTVPPDEIMKFALLNNKSFAIVGSNPQSKIEERAMCRIVEHKAIKDAIAGLKEAHADWSQDLPHLIKGLGIRNREKKLERLKRRGKLDAYLKKEHRNMRLLQELTGIDLKANDDAASGVTNDKEKKKKSGGSSRSRKRKREQNLDEQTLKIVKKKGKVAEGMKKQSTGAGVNGEDSEVDGEENDDDGGSLIKKMGVDEQEENSEDDVMESDSDSEDLSSGNNNNDATDESEELDEEYDDDSDKSDMDDDSQKPLTICNGNESPMKTVDEQKLNGKLSLGKIEMKGKKEKNIGKKKEDMNMGKPAQPVITNTLKKAEVKQLYLKNMEAFGKDDDLSKTEENGTIDLNEDDDDDEEEGEDEEDKEDEDEDEEDFFELGVKKKAKSSFFLGGTDDHEEDDNDDDDDDDDDAVDTSKYFKRNLYREGRGGRSGMKKEERFGGKSWEEDDGERNGFTERRGRGRGGFSDRRGGRDSFGDGRGGRGGFGDREDGRDRDESSDRGGRGNFTERGGRGRGESSDRRGRGNFLKRGGRGRGESSDRRGRGNFTERGGRGRGESGDRRERGNFGERGGRGESGGRSGGSFSNRRGGGRGRGQSGDRRGGRGRGRFGRGGGFGQMNSDNPNLIPLTSASTGTSPSFPASTSRPQTSLLHPSWMAKKKERLQSSAVNAFQGKRVVFD